jgi:hypothetical protein
MRRTLILHGAAALLACGAAGAAAQAAPTPPQPATLFSNVRVFDGKAGTLSAPGNVLVVGNVIKRISASAIAAEPNTALPTRRAPSRPPSAAA